MRAKMIQFFFMNSSAYVVTSNPKYFGERRTKRVRVTSSTRITVKRNQTRRRNIGTERDPSPTAEYCELGPYLQATNTTRV